MVVAGCSCTAGYSRAAAGYCCDGGDGCYCRAAAAAAAAAVGAGAAAAVGAAAAAAAAAGRSALGSFYGGGREETGVCSAWVQAAGAGYVWVRVWVWVWLWVLLRMWMAAK